jgi:hypothetical protein
MLVVLRLLVLVLVLLLHSVKSPPHAVLAQQKERQQCQYWKQSQYHHQH